MTVTHSPPVEVIVSLGDFYLLSVETENRESFIPHPLTFEMQPLRPVCE